MANFQSTKTTDSQKYEGVSFTFKVLTEGVRNRLNLSLAPHLSRLRTLNAELIMLDLPEEGKPTPDVEAKAINILDEMKRIRDVHVDPAYFKECFVSIDATFDNQVITDPVKLMEVMPVDLFEEITAEITAAAQLSQAEAANLKSPTTSAAQVDGKTPGTTAASVSEKDTTSNETALATSQTT